MKSEECLYIRGYYNIASDSMAETTMPKPLVGERKVPNNELHSAASLGNFREVVKAVRSGANVNSRDENNLTPLMLAAIGVVEGGERTSEYIKVIKFLIDNGANKIATARGFTAADYAKYCKRPNIALVLETYTPFKEFIRLPKE